MYKKYILILLSAPLTMFASSKIQDSQPTPIITNAKCMFSYDMDDTVDHNGNMTPGFQASAQIAADYGCALIMNSDQGIPSRFQYALWNPGPKLSGQQGDLHSYLFGSTEMVYSQDITYGNKAEYNCTYNNVHGDSAKNCRILKMEPVFNKTKPISNQCVFHFDDTASEVYHVYKGWNDQISLGANPIYVKDLSSYYTTKTDPVSGFDQPWYTDSVADAKVKLMELLKDKLDSCTSQ
jgi:hypothetical protein